MSKDVAAVVLVVVPATAVAAHASARSAVAMNVSA